MTALVSCAWCQAEFPTTYATCPRCGAGTDVRTAADEDGWIEAAPIKDMAEIQFGRSHAQIEGLVVPVADVDLADGDTVFCTHDKLLWYEGNITLSTLSSGVFKAMRTGMPLTLMQAQGPGRIAFSDNHPGELIAIPLQPGSDIRCRQHHFLLATGNVEYEGFRHAAWYEVGSGSDAEFFHPVGYCDSFEAKNDQPGLVLLHAAGNVFRRKLGSDEAIDVSPHTLLAWEGGLRHNLVIERRQVTPGSKRWHHYISLRLTGPGNVWIQSGATGKTEQDENISSARKGTIWRDL